MLTRRSFLITLAAAYRSPSESGDRAEDARVALAGLAVRGDGGESHGDPSGPPVQARGGRSARRHSRSGGDHHRERSHLSAQRDRIGDRYENTHGPRLRSASATQTGRGRDRAERQPRLCSERPRAHVSIIDAKTNRHLALCAWERGRGASPSRPMASTCTRRTRVSNDVSVIDVVTRRLIATIPVGAEAWA